MDILPIVPFHKKVLSLLSHSSTELKYSDGESKLDPESQDITFEVVLIYSVLSCWPTYYLVVGKMRDC